ncbi:MAG: alpha-ketoglutarate-dependent dioxygenase AlkB [Cyclobacteriaceae bacterium]
MELFPTEQKVNLLPYDGEVIYLGKILNAEKSASSYRHMMNNIAWEHDEAYIFGKHFITKRKAAWYGDQDYSYTYSNATKQAHPWTKELLELKRLTEQISNERYNSCLLNLYHSGEEGMAWHSDDEKMLRYYATIASISLGAERRFLFKHKKTGERVTVYLENGSLLLMKGATQDNWLHRLPPTKKVRNPRVNLTFRTMVTA